MNVERVRSILGVWAPMTIGLFIILTSISFYFTAELADSPIAGNLESWRLVCSAGAFFVGAVLLLSTFGRYRKSTEARRERLAVSPSPMALATPPNDGLDAKVDGDSADE